MNTYTHSDLNHNIDPSCVLLFAFVGTSTTDAAGHSAEFRYDTANRLIAAKLPKGITRYAYRQVSPHTPAKLVAIDGAAKEIRRYDGQGGLRARIRAIGEAVYSTRWHYDENGRLTRHTLPSGKTLRYAYQDGALTGIALAAGPLPTVWPAIPILSGLNDEPPGALLHDVIHGNGIQTVRQIQHNKLTGLSVGGLYDLRYAYGPQGRITAIDRKTYPSGKTHPLRRYRYDQHGRLDFALTPWALYGYSYGPNGNRSQTVINGREGIYAYRPTNNRLTALTQQAPTWHTPLKAKPLRVADQPRFLAAPPMRTTTAVHYSATGQRLALNGLRLKYNANGQVKAVYAGDTRIASYSYDSRARRIAKTVYGKGISGPPQQAGGKAQPRKTALNPAAKRSDRTIHYLYQNNLLIAEADAKGNIRREYVYTGGKPIAILQGNETYAIHTNHLGAPVAVTDQHRELVWQAAYAPFGRAYINEDPDNDGNAFVLNLRLPGQYEDTETGLYYNHHRTYNPDTGRYLSPDPLGLAAGPNPYVYAANDPVNYIDPTGLLLFAFDGTNNADGLNGVPVDERTNVYQFREAYRGDPGEVAIDFGNHGAHWYYITGAGRADPRSGITESTLDLAGGTKTAERVLTMSGYFYDYMEQLMTGGQLPATGALNIDMVGFSRGAAEARIFANLLDSLLSGDDTFEVIRNFDFIDGYESNHSIDFKTEFRALRLRGFLDATCLNVNLRFLGLWDTVPHLEVAQGDDAIEAAGNDGQAYLGIPASVGHAAHAVAVNENRANWGAWSIHANPGGNRAGRVELGFIGDHSNIGGAHANSDLGDIAFMWMIKHARMAGVPEGAIDFDLIATQVWDVVSDPKLRDLVLAPPEDADIPGFLAEPIYAPGREFYYLSRNSGSGSVVQKDWEGEGQMTYELSLEFMEQNIYQDHVNNPNDNTDSGDFGSGGPSGNSPYFNDGLTEGDLKIGEDGEYIYETWLEANYALSVEMVEADQ